MATTPFGTPFSSGRSSGAGYGTSIQSDSRGTTTKAPSAFGNGGNMGITSEGWKSNEEEEDDSGGFATNVEERILKEQQEAANKAAKEADRLKAEEEARKAEQERIEREALAAKAAAEKAKAAAEKTRGVTATGVLAEEEAPPSPSPSPQVTPEQIRARQAVARNLRAALGADEGEDRDAMIEGARKDAAAAGVSDDAFNSFLEREQARPPLGTYGRPTQEQIAARQDAANRIKAGIRSGDSNVLSAAREDAELAGVVPGDVYDFITRQEEELAKRGQISRVGASGKPSGLDEYYQTQTEKSRGVPTGFSSGRSGPNAPNWRIHTRLNRLVNRNTYQGEQDRSISPEAAAMRYEEATGRKLAADSPLDYIKMQRDLAEKRRIALEMGTTPPFNSYGFGGRQ